MRPRFSDLEDEYTDLLASAELTKRMRGAAEATAKKVLNGMPRYEAVSAATGVPPLVIGLIHAMESGVRWNTHLHNGDSLKRRTRHVPRGRPRAGTPPFTWEESAIDAVRYDGLHKVKEWSLERLCWELEKFNGLGYLMYHPSVNSPYLWSGTTNYMRGKYVADGKWSSRAVSGQTGAIAILKQVEVLAPDVLDAFRSPDAIEESGPVEDLTPESYGTARQPAPVPVPAKVAVGAGVSVAVTEAVKDTISVVPPAPPPAVTETVSNVSGWKGVGESFAAFGAFAWQQPWLVCCIVLFVVVLIFGPKYLPEKWRVT